MANFANAYAKLALMEGLYSNAPTDSGGETVCGISRVFWPKWSGWAIVDTFKTYPNFPANLKSSLELSRAVQNFYREHFWDRFNLDNFDQPLATELFEQSVNLGEGRMTKHLQQVLNALNYQKKFGPDLSADGAFGPRTLLRLKETVADKRSRAVQYGINGLQCAYYINLALSNTAKRQYASGWLAQRGEATGEK